MQNGGMMISLYHMVNMDLMANYNDKHFPLAIVDPEYGIGESSKNHHSRNTPVKQKNGVSIKIENNLNYTKKLWDNKPASNEYFNELIRVSVNQIVFGANYFEYIMPICKPPRRSNYDDFLIKNPIGFIIWDKVNGTSDFNDCEVIYTSFHFKSFVLKYMWAGMMQGVSIKSGTKMQGNKKLNEKRIHPTQKPVIIYKYLLEKFAKPGYNVLDTHLGSGSIAIACEDLEVDLTACEKEKDIYLSAKERLNIHQKTNKLKKTQTVLF